MSIQNLIAQTKASFVKAQGTDLADLYEYDLNSFESVQWLMNEDLTDDVVTNLDRMDTEPREQIIMAIADEYGVEYVETVLGYKILA